MAADDPSEQDMVVADNNGSTPTSSAATVDHCYSAPSPRKLKRKVEETLESNFTLRKKQKMEQKRTRMLKKKVEHLDAVVDDLREKSLICSDCAELLEKTFSGVPLDVMQRLLCKKQEKARKYQCS